MKPRLTELTKFNTFVIPPFTREKIIFFKENAVFQNPLKAVLTFSVGDYQATTSVQRIMIMFNIKGPGQNSYAIGFPKQNFGMKEIEKIFKTKELENDSYVKENTSRKNASVKLKKGSQIFWPPENQRVPGGFEVTYSIGNCKRCVGEITLKKIREPRVSTASIGRININESYV